MPHWGVEYQAHPTADQKEKARELVAAGAKAIIGAHPHVIEDHEWIGQVPVFYSLGNFLFDQYFSAETMKGQVVELNLQKTDHGPVLDSVDIYEASTASHKPVSMEKAP
jgi:poly-gamma-glutamate synthesis protein (capsule biosynthesis protein)